MSHYAELGGESAPRLPGCPVYSHDASFATYLLDLLDLLDNLKKEKKYFLPEVSGLVS